MRTPNGCACGRRAASLAGSGEGRDRRIAGGSARACAVAVDEAAVGQAPEEGLELRALCLRERRARQARVDTPGLRRIAPEVRVMRQHRIEGREAAVVHVGGGEGDVAQGGYPQRM